MNQDSTRPRSTRSPSSDSTAGRPVSEPTMAAATTSMEATPSATNVASPEISMPAIAIMTVKPEISTA